MYAMQSGFRLIENGNVTSLQEINVHRLIITPYCNRDILHKISMYTVKSQRHIVAVTSSTTDQCALSNDNAILQSRHLAQQINVHCLITTPYCNRDILHNRSMYTV